jgi:hypothetical protein
MAECKEGCGRVARSRGMYSSQHRPRRFGRSATLAAQTRARGGQLSEETARPDQSVRSGSPRCPMDRLSNNSPVSKGLPYARQFC